jgi:hypothetical protein
MSLRTLRITVRGSFRDLTDDQRAELRVRAAEHDVLRASFTTQGHLAYDVDARPFFTYRFLCEGETDEDLARAVAGAEAAARAALEQQGLGYQLRSTHAQGPLPGSPEQEAAARQGLRSPARPSAPVLRDLPGPHPPPRSPSPPVPRSAADTYP